jgi:hypothetical protein
MGRIRSSLEPDLFSATVARETASAPTARSHPLTVVAAAAPTASTPYVLPSDLEKAVSQLRDEDFDRLVDAVHAEQKRRDRKIDGATTSGGRQRIESAPVPLTSSKLNAVRAAFKAGVKPTQIARQFGITQADVRKALAAEAP